MACSSYTMGGIAAGCKDSIGGIKKAWFAPDGSVNATANASGAVTIPSGDINNFKVYNFRKATGSMTSTLNTSETAGNSFTTDVTLQFLKQEGSKRLEIMALLMNEMVGIVKDGNGKYWYLGLDYPISATAGTAETGTAMTDLNGYNITITDNSVDLPCEITDASTIAALEAINIVSGS